MDHITRIQSRSSGSIQAENTLLEVLEKIQVPSGLCLIFGSQAGGHLDFIQEKFGNDAFFEINGFDKLETKEFLNKMEFSDEFLNENLDRLYEITSGLPLLVNYLGKQIKQTGNFEGISDIPLTEGDVKIYYAYLWTRFSTPNQTRMFARFLSLLEFSAIQN